MLLTKEALLKKMKQDHVLVLDVLPEVEFQKIHIRGSRNLPLTQDYSAFVQEADRLYGKNRIYITYCSGHTNAVGANAAKILREHGFAAENYPGGVEEWNEAGYPVDGIQTGKLAGSPQ